MTSRRRLRSTRFLPEGVTMERSQHGTPRYKFRKKGLKGGYFKSQIGTEAFREEYHRFLHPEAETSEAPVARKPRATAGSIDEALNRYMEVPERLGPSAVTQAKIRAILEDFREGDEISGYRGTRQMRGVTFEAIDKIIAKKKIKTGTGNKTKGGLFAAIKLRKELVRFFDFSVKAGLIDTNPAAMADRVKIPKDQKSKGFRTWSEEDIAQFRAQWKLGTKERLAMELYLWTDQRRCDVYRMGRNQIVGGRLPVTQEKTGKTLWVAVAPQLLEAILAMKPADTSPFCFVVSRKGTAYTKESFGNWFKDACKEAGLMQHNGHGLRKATLRRLADLQAANKTMKALSGQEKDETLAIYTADADQIRLADTAVTMLARWEMQAKATDDRGEYRFTAND